MFKRIWKWFEPTLVGDDGLASHRRLSVLYFIIMLTYMIVKTANGSIFPEIAWIVVSGGAGLMSGLSVWQQKINSDNKKLNENSEG